MLECDVGKRLIMCDVTMLVQSRGTPAFYSVPTQLPNLLPCFPALCIKRERPQKGWFGTIANFKSMIFCIIESYLDLVDNRYSYLPKLKTMRWITAR